MKAAGNLFKLLSWPFWYLLAAHQSVCAQTTVVVEWMETEFIATLIGTLITVNSNIIRVIIKNMVIPFQEIYNTPLFLVQFINVYLRQLSARSCVYWLQ